MAGVTMLFNPTLFILRRGGNSVLRGNRETEKRTVGRPAGLRTEEVMMEEEKQVEGAIDERAAVSPRVVEA